MIAGVACTIAYVSMASMACTHLGVACTQVIIACTHSGVTWTYAGVACVTVVFGSGECALMYGDGDGDVVL